MNSTVLLAQYVLLPKQDPEALAAWADRAARYLSSLSEADQRNAVLEEVATKLHFMGDHVVAAIRELKRQSAPEGSK